MVQAICPGCGQTADLGESPAVGDRYECENCAGEVFQVEQEGDAFAPRPVKRASCPVCGEMKEIPEGAAPGDKVSCCGREFTLTYEYDAFALEEPSHRQPSSDGPLRG